MAYKPNIPLATDQLKVSQADLLGNFQAINTLFNLNHVAFGQIGAGKHKYLTMPEQAVTPTTLADEGVLYTAEGNKSLVTELFFRRESNGPSVNITQGLANPNETTNGYAYIGSSLVKWGSAASVGPNNLLGNYSMVFPVAADIPEFTTAPIVFTAPISSSGITTSATFIKNSNLNTRLAFGIRKDATLASITVIFLAIGT